MEPGFYQLLHSSKHPAAKRFQRWVYSEVLPKLRAEGGYILPSASTEQLEALHERIAEQQDRIASFTKRLISTLLFVTVDMYKFVEVQDV